MAEKRSFNALEDAVRSGRAAFPPAWLTVGQTVWYWRETSCPDNPCMYMVTPECPLNRGVRWYEEEAIRCARKHPELARETVWSLCAYFTPNGVEWSGNDMPAVHERYVRRVYFSTRAEAEKVRPREVVPGG